jgi:protein-arginine kinase activator protein McsA
LSQGRRRLVVVEAWLLQCELCGRWFTQFRGLGRPRTFCQVCVPPGTFRRRPYVPVGPREIVCDECGVTFSAKSLAARLCSRRCKDAKYRREHREMYRQAQARKYRRRRARARGGEA